MKHKTAELEGVLLDAAVAKAEGHVWSTMGEDDGATPQVLVEGWPGVCFSPATFWEDAGPIIERERIQIVSPRQGYWSAVVGDRGMFSQVGGPTPLIAAMRAYVASKFGEEVELP